MYKELLKLNNKKATALKNGPKALTDTLPKKTDGWQVYEKVFHIHVIRETHIKTTRYNYTPIKMAKIQNTNISNAGEDVE